MAIKPQFKINDIRKRFDAFLNEVDKAQIEALQVIGEMCVAHAREIPPDIGFKDQTGNLRSSIGYVIYKNGTAIISNYDQVLNGNEGVERGRQLADDVGSQTKSLTLVVTAGMNYATYVEAKGRDVLSSAELLAQRELPKELKALIDDIKISLK